MKNVIGLVIVFCSVLFLQSCNDNECKCIAPPVSTQLQGEWEWIQTATATRTITPEQTGYTKSIIFSNDGNSDYLKFYQKDSLTATLIRSRSGSQEDEKANLVTLKFNPEGYIKFHINNNQLEFGELMNTYSEQSDTIRHFYVRKMQ